MATLRDVLDALSHVADRTGRWTIDDFADYSGCLGASPQQLDATLAKIHHRHPELFDPRTGAPVIPSPRPPPEPPPNPTTGEHTGPQSGEAAAAVKNAETALARVQSTVAEFDRQIIEAITHAHKTTEDGLRRLRQLEQDIGEAVETFRLDTPAGVRDFQRYLIGQLREILAVVQEANDDDVSKQALAAALTALYAAQDIPEDQAAPGPPLGEPGAAPLSVADPDTDFADAVPSDAGLLDTGAATPAVPAPPPTAPAMPSIPSFGAPAGGPPPTGGLPDGGPLSGLVPGRGRERSKLEPDDPVFGPEENWPADDQVPSDDAPGIDSDDPAPATAADPNTVVLPNGQTVTATSPQLAAAIKAVAEGIPIAEAFGQQEITVPPPGTPVADPVEASRVIPGDIGMFIDRQALAIGDGKALLDGQIQHITNVTGPSFLGWQHPPAPGPTTAPTATEPTPPEAPTPTRPSATVAT